MQRVVALTVAVAAVCATVLAPLAVALPARAATPVLPTQDGFYTYTGKTPLADVSPGTILLDAAGNPVERTVHLAAGTNALPVPTAEQVLYRTSDELGRPTATVTTILVPGAAPQVTPKSAVAPNIVAYLSFYDSLSAKCDPSFTLQGGDPGSANTQLTSIEQALVQLYAAKDVVTVPDFEGEHLDWTAGHEAGYDTLDAIRATEQYLATDPKTTKVGLTGYSGGSIAADWASELAPSYAPELDIVGVAEAGVPVDFAHNLDYIEGTTDWAPVIPATLATLSRSFGVDLTPYLSAEGLAAVAATRDQCIGEFAQFPGLTIQSLLKPQYQDPYAIPAFVKIINALIMGTGPGTPKGPLYLAVGNDPNRKQAQGDDIMVTDDVRALAHQYCTRGVPVHFQELTNATHSQAALEFEPQAVAFLQQRFAGVPFTPDSCDTIGVGNSLAPVVLHETPTAGSSSSGNTSGSPSAAASARSSGGGDLAMTGSDPLVAVGALGLVAAGALAAVLRRRR